LSAQEVNTAGKFVSNIVQFGLNSIECHLGLWFDGCDIAAAFLDKVRNNL
jgi:hypothetical protein